MVTKDETGHSFKTNSFFYFYEFLKNSFLRFHSLFSENKLPIPEKTAEHRDWSLFARKRLHELDDISLTAGIRSHHIVLLKNQGLHTLSKLAQQNSSLKKVKGIPQITLQSLKDQALIQFQSRGQQKPLYKILKNQNSEHKGLEALPPPHEADLFFDMEGYPLFGTEGLEYLYGNAVHEKPGYIYFWAENKNKEAEAFKNWLKWAYFRWEKNPGMHIYHYGHYEPSTLKKLMGKYSLLENEMDTLLKNQVFVNLHRVVTQSLRIGVFSYSIKEVEQLYFRKRATENKNRRWSGRAVFSFLKLQ